MIGNNMIYLDNSATTRPFPEAVERMTRSMLDTYFNPHAAYSPAVHVERETEECRRHMREAFGDAGEIIFTSGGTESNNMSILGTLAVLHSHRPHIVSSSAEHPSVWALLESLAGKGKADVSFCDPGKDGAIDPDVIAEALRPDTAIVSCMVVNNETGAVTDVSGIRRRMDAVCPQALLHTDGVQAFCKLPFGDPVSDLYSLSGHKFHGPKGIGALFVRTGVRFGGGQIGGGQEKGMRSGTLNVPGILGMDTALAAYRENREEWVRRMRSLKIRLANRILDSVPDVFINGPAPGSGAPHILNLSFSGVRGEVLLHSLEEDGILVSTGSACSSRKKGGNRVLAGMGLSADRQQGAIRFSLCPFNTEQEIDLTVERIREKAVFLRRFRRR